MTMSRWMLPALGLAGLTVLVLARRKRSFGLSSEQHQVLLDALKELARRFFPVCQDLASIAKTVRTKMQASAVEIPEGTLQEQLLRQCQVFEKLQQIQSEVAAQYHLSEAEFQEMQENNEDTQVQSYTAGFQSMLNEALKGNSPVLPNVKIPELLSKEMALKILECAHVKEAKEALATVKGNRCSLKELGEVLNAAHRVAWQKAIEENSNILGEHGSEVYHSVVALYEQSSKEFSAEKSQLEERHQAKMITIFEPDGNGHVNVRRP